MAEESAREQSQTPSEAESYATADEATTVEYNLLTNQLDALQLHPSLVPPPLLPPPATTASSSSPTRRPTLAAPAQLVADEIPTSPQPSTSSLRTAVILQESCLLHKYTRNSDIGTIVERPERIRAVKTGVAAAWARLEGQAVARGEQPWKKETAGEQGKDDTLLALMGALGLQEKGGNGKGKGKGEEVKGGPFDIVFSNAALDARDPALLFIHPLPNLPPGAEEVLPLPPPPPSSTPSSTPRRPHPSSPAPPSSTPTSKAALPHIPPPPTAPPPAWPLQLQSLCQNSTMAMLSSPFSEIPPHLPQGDLYLCPGSEEAIFGALGAVCEGVDRIVQGGEYDRAFVAIRPPGHHCCEAQPMGFCFVNNVAVAAAHAHQKHGIDRVVILDVDLHHGNGTQDIAWRINATANRVLKAASDSAPPRKGSPRKPVPRQLQIMYASMHDVFSYPCEDGDETLIQQASLNLSGGHSQYISNVHLDSWESEEDDFWPRLYPRYVQGMLGAAAEFCRKTAVGGVEESERTIVMISAGFDASEHESAGMSRHHRNVPTSFYHRFSLDVAAFANKFAKGRVLATLEGGYSDRALASGAMAMMVGLTEARRLQQRWDGVKEEEEGKAEETEETRAGWWSEKALVRLEKACKPKRGGKLTSAATSLSRTTSGFALGTGGGVIANAGGVGGGEDEEELWLARTLEVFSLIEGVEITPIANSKTTTGDGQDKSRTMQLRERRPNGRGGNSSLDATPLGTPNHRTAGTKTVVDNPVTSGTRDGKGEEEEGREPKEEDATVRPMVPKIKFTFKAGGDVL